MQRFVRGNDARRRRGFSLMELLIVVAIILIIGAIAIPKLNTARMQAQEMAAISQIRTIHQGQTMYFSQFGKYAQTLQELGPPASGQPGPNGADLVPGDLAAGLKSGYNFQMLPSPTGYMVQANPVAYLSTGRRSFYSDNSLTVRENWGAEPATPTSKEIK